MSHEKVDDYDEAHVEQDIDNAEDDKDNALHVVGETAVVEDGYDDGVPRAHS